MKNVETSTDLVLFFGIGQALVTDVFENILSSKCTNSLEDGMRLSRTDFCINIIIMIMSLHRPKSVGWLWNWCITKTPNQVNDVKYGWIK